MANKANSKAAQAAEETIPVPKGYERAMKLSSGAVVAIKPYMGKDVKQIMRVVHANSSRGDFAPTDMIFYVVAYCCLYNGKKLTFEDLDDIPGADLQELMAEFQGKL